MYTLSLKYIQLHVMLYKDANTKMSVRIKTLTIQLVKKTLYYILEN